MHKQLDMKVLRAIHVLSTSGSVTKAAEILQVTPGAVSYLINKARKSTGSALFFRTRSGMKPNTLALELSQRYQSINQDYYADDATSPLNSRTIVMSTPSILELLLTVSLLNNESDSTELAFRKPSETDLERLARLRNKEIDIDIGSRLPVDNSIIQLKLFSSEVGILVRKEHPKIKHPFTLDDWHQNRHAIWSRGMHFISDSVEQTQHFRNLFEKQDIAFVASSSLNLVTLCAFSDLVMLIPTSIGKKLPNFLPVQLLNAPSELQMRYECYLHYHHSFSGDEHFQQLLIRTQKFLQS